MSAVALTVQGGALITTTRIPGHWTPIDVAFGLLCDGAAERVVVAARSERRAFVESEAGDAAVLWPGGFAAVSVSWVTAPVGRLPGNLDVALKAVGLRRRAGHELWRFEAGTYSGLIPVDLAVIPRQRPRRRGVAGCRAFTT